MEYDAMPNGHALKFPLPDGYFPPVTLTPEEIACYEQRVEIIMKNALAEYNLHEAMGPRPDYGSRWNVVGAVEHLTAIREHDPARAVDAYRVFGRVDGDYRNFIDFFYSVTSQQLFAVNQFMLGHAVDAAVLSNIHTKDSGKPHMYLGIKWVCLQPSRLSRNRDSCFLEYLVYTKDLQGRDVGVRITLPLVLAECLPLPERLKTLRVHSHTVTIVRPTDDNTDATQLFMTSENDAFKGAVLSSTSPFKKFMITLSSMALFADSKRISMHGMKDRRSWVSKKSRANCGVCKRKFSATRRRQHCRLCGDVACRRCMTIRDAPQLDDEAGMTPRTFQVVKTMFCKVCMTKVRDVDIGTLVTMVSTDSQDEGISSDGDSGAWYLHSQGKQHTPRFDSELFDTRCSFAETGGSSVISLSPVETSSARSAAPHDTIDEESHQAVSDSMDKSAAIGGSSSRGVDPEVQSETKTSVSSEGEDQIGEFVEPAPAMMIDLRHLRTMAGAERVVAAAEEEELRVMRASFAALDFPPVHIGETPSEDQVDSVRGSTTAAQETDEVSPRVVQQQIVASPLHESPMDEDTVTEQSLFASSRANMYATNTIDQCLAEQEALLQRLVMAASSSGFYPASSRRPPTFDQ